MKHHLLRNAVATISAMAMLTSLAACGGSETAQSDEKELTISWYYSSGGGDTVERAIKLYKKEACAVFVG